MQKIKSFCPSFKLPGSGRRNRNRNRKNDLESGSGPKELLTPEVLEARRQDRLLVLQKECENLENQLTGK